MTGYEIGRLQLLRQFLISCVHQSIDTLIFVHASIGQSDLVVEIWQLSLKLRLLISHCRDFGDKLYFSSSCAILAFAVQVSLMPAPRTVRLLYLIVPNVVSMLLEIVEMHLDWPSA